MQWVYRLPLYCGAGGTGIVGIATTHLMFPQEYSYDSGSHALHDRAPILILTR